MSSATLAAGWLSAAPNRASNAATNASAHSETTCVPTRIASARSSDACRRERDSSGRVSDTHAASVAAASARLSSCADPSGS